MKEEEAIWRQPPEESFSDWTINVTVDASPAEQEAVSYHVHRSHLISGPRKSQYFVKLFKCQGFQEAATRTSFIEVPQSAADAFPAMLDFVYLPVESLSIHSKSAAALYFLGDYFEIPVLREEAEQFWGSDLSKDNLFTYYEEAKRFHNEKLLDAVAANWVEHHWVTKFSKLRKLLSLPEGHRDLLFDPAMLLKVLSNVQNRQDRIEGANIIIGFMILFDKNGTEITKEHFAALTDEQVLPLITDPTFALFILDEDLKIRRREGVDDGEDCRVLTDLQNRCVAAIAKGWDTLNQSFGDDLERWLELLPRKIVVAILLKLCG